MTGGSLHLERSPHPNFDMGIGGGGGWCGYLSGIYSTRHLKAFNTNLFKYHILAENIIMGVLV